jgi:exonuclease III
MKYLVMIKLLLSLSIFILTITAAQSKTYRIGAWNIQDLHHQEGFSLRQFGDFFSKKRKASDFELLLKYRDQFGKDGKPADVVALQEIGTKAALERIFPSSEYETLMSKRHISDDAEEGKGDVYTALAVRKASGIKILERDDLSSIAILHSDGRPTRAGTGALLEINSKRVWFMSLHMKSSCAYQPNASTSTVDDCETLTKQIPILVEWIKSKKEAGERFILAGDFNRRFRAFNFNGEIWKLLNDTPISEELDTQYVSAHPETATRKCPTKKGNSTQPIDWIMLDAEVADWFVEGSYWERRFKRSDTDASRGGISDHCPISIDINIE